MMNLPIQNPYNHRIMRTPLGIFDLDVKGQIILNSKYNTFKIILFEFFGNNGSLGSYFRGENDKYPSFLTSWKRLKTKTEKCLWWLKKREFIKWFISTPYFQHFTYRFEYAYDPENIPEGQGRKFCFDLEALLQHYEFPTNYLDVTTKCDVAKFFAYTHCVNGKLVPIEDFRHRKPCLYSSFAGKLQNPYNKDIRIVGFQVLQRPTKQQAMAIYLARNIDYRKEMHCEELPRDKKAAFEIYDKMNGGELLFPDDYASRIATAIKNKYDQEKIINEDVFEDYCKEFALNPSHAKRYFNNLGYSITYDKVESSEEEKNNMQEEIDTEIIPWINEFIMDANPYHLLKKKQ